ncbi:MAG TPA: hypothetical protein VF265_09150 [Nevskiaceae bacterium]
MEQVTELPFAEIEDAIESMHADAVLLRYALVTLINMHRQRDEVRHVIVRALQAAIQPPADFHPPFDPTTPKLVERAHALIRELEARAAVKAAADAPER